jgi:hypothetical protein
MQRFARFLLVVLVVTITGLYPLVAPPPHRIDQAHFALIKGGMTKADVERIFGVAPGLYDWAEETPTWMNLALIDGTSSTLIINEHHTPFSWPLLNLHSPDSSVCSWVSRHASFTVIFDDRVAWTIGGESRITPPWKRWWHLFWKT